jgi:hypothetical protein
MSATLVGFGIITDNGGGNMTPAVPSYSGPAHIYIITGHAPGDAGTTRPNLTAFGGEDIGDPSGAPNITRFWFVDPTGGGFTVPAGISWKASGITQAAYCEVWQGLDTGQGTGFSPAGRSATSINLMPGPTFGNTPSQPGCVNFFDGIRITAQGSTTISPASGFTMSQSGNKVVNGRIVIASCYQIQTTPTAVAANISMSQSPADTSAESCQGTLVSVLPLQTPIYVPSPPMSLGGMNVQVCQ